MNLLRVWPKLQKTHPPMVNFTDAECLVYWSLSAIGKNVSKETLPLLDVADANKIIDWLYRIVSAGSWNDKDLWLEWIQRVRKTINS